jgi:hypothetical protein
MAVEATLRWTSSSTGQKKQEKEEKIAQNKATFLDTLKTSGSQNNIITTCKN